MLTGLYLGIFIVTDIVMTILFAILMLYVLFWPVTISTWFIVGIGFYFLGRDKKSTWFDIIVSALLGPWGALYNFKGIIQHKKNVAEEQKVAADAIKELREKRNQS